MSDRVAAGRRAWLRAGVCRGTAIAAVPALAACAGIPTVLPGGSTPDGRRLLDAAAEAHGLPAYRRLHDVALAYDGQWHGLVERLQPVLVDRGYRQRSEERLMPRLGLVAQRHRGPAGVRHVLRRRFARAGAVDDPATAPTIRVWTDGRPDTDPERLAASALVADAWPLFQFGPLALADSGAAVDVAPARRIDGRLCDGLAVRQEPGLGHAIRDDLILYIDRETRLTRRIRFTLNGLASTRGAVVEVDLDAYLDRHGIRWPVAFFERLMAPIPYLPVHRWRLTGLDVDRLYRADALMDPGGFRGRAGEPAADLLGGQ